MAPLSHFTPYQTPSKPRFSPRRAGFFYVCLVHGVSSKLNKLWLLLQLFASNHKTGNHTPGQNMALTDTFVKNAKYIGSSSKEKYTDGKGMYLLVIASGKYWRMDYRFAGKRKTLALGVYPAVSLEEARRKANSAHELLNGGIDPVESNKSAKQVRQQTAQGLRPRHPGAVLRDIVLPGLSVSAESFAELLNLPFDCIFQILNESAPMTCEVALKLERLISIKAESWLTMQQAVDLWDARTEFKRFQDFGKSLRLEEFTTAPEPTQDDLDASNNVLVAKAVSISKAAMELIGFPAIRG